MIKFTVPMMLIGTQLVRENYDFERGYCDELRNSMHARG